MEKILKVMIDVCDRCYYEDKDLDITIREVIDNDEMIIEMYEKHIIFGFAGSNDVKDWVNNFRADSLKEHKGFETSFNKFKTIIYNVVDKNKDRDIYVTGHSRGGALATKCAEYIAKNFKPCSCFAFASPKIGNREYRDMYNKLPINHTVIRNGWDIVTYLPPMIYRHVGKIIRLKQKWWHKITYWKVNDHLLESYIKSINKYYNNKKD